MRNYDDREMEREWQGDLCSPCIYPLTWLDYASMAAIAAIVLYVMAHQWLHWL